MYAIINERTGKWVYGTDFERHTQRTSYERALLFESLEDAELEFKRRRCGKDYKIVECRLEVME